jgi:hypothetical protein
MFIVGILCTTRYHSLILKIVLSSISRSDIVRSLSLSLLHYSLDLLFSP